MYSTTVDELDRVSTGPTVVLSASLVDACTTVVCLLVVVCARRESSVNDVSTKNDRTLF